MSVALLAGITAATSVLDAYGRYKSAKGQADQMRQQSILDSMRADELLERNEINNTLLGIQEGEITSQLVAQTAGRGIALESSSTAGLIAQNARLLVEQQIQNNHNADFEAAMIREGADSQKVAAANIESAGKMTAFASLLQGGVRTYGATQ